MLKYVLGWTRALIGPPDEVRRRYRILESHSRLKTAIDTDALRSADVDALTDFVWGRRDEITILGKTLRA